jgi:PadR family transcriptional regulator AphA
MPDPAEPTLSLPEWVVLCLIREQPTHGFAIAGLLSRQGSLGEVWRVARPVVYRAIQRLEALGFTEQAGQERSALGPVRSLTRATPAGQQAARTWLTRPAIHARDVRSELLVKLALLDRAGVDPRSLLTAQHRQLIPIAAALSERARDTTGIEHTTALWRHEAMTATMRFLDAMTQEDAAAPG